MNGHCVVRVESVDDHIRGGVWRWWGSGSVTGWVECCGVISSSGACAWTFLKEGVQYEFKLISQGATFVLGGFGVVRVEGDIKLSFSYM